MQKIAVILFNLGGPDNLKSVRPFLFNLFNDKNIIPLNSFFRFILAFLISSLRLKKAQNIYKKIGGKSPILEQTILQANALEKKLNIVDNKSFKIFTAMRYWHPFADDVIKNIKANNFDKIVLLPLYPQFSTTTTKSSFEQWDNLADKYNLNIITHKICCYPDNDGFTDGYATQIKQAMTSDLNRNYEIIFSAHGIPQECVDKGDPYQSHVEKSVDKIVDKLKSQFNNFNHTISYQSKVGPKKWLLPNTEDIIAGYSKEKKHLIIVPIAFVSEHSETLVELDMDYKDLATEAGALSYIRIPAVGINAYFIDGLAKLVNDKLDNVKFTKKCDAKFCKCMFDK